MISTLWWNTASAAPEMIPAEVFERARASAATAGGEPETASLALKDGASFSFAEHRGKPVLLSFWASWCGPCRAELPALDTWSASHPDVTVVAVNVDRQRAPAERFLQTVKFDLPIGFDPDAQQLGKYGVTSMPTMLLFDGAGRLAWQHVGYSTEKGFTELDAALGGVK
jgi:thiol-disulfide isomerase/thioredoxin